MNWLGRRAWSRFVTVTAPLWKSEVRFKALGVLAVLLVLLLSVKSLDVVNSYVNRDFMTAIAGKHVAVFWHLALLYFGVFVLSTIAAALARFAEEHLGLLWRDWLTRHLTDRYLGKLAYYRMTGRADIDNPDQRIAEDVKTFTTSTLSFILILLNSTLALLAFSGVLWSITPWLVLAAVSYAGFGSLVALLLGKRLVGLDISQLKKEADFRYELIRVRENAERVALHGGESSEGSRLRRRLAALVENWRRIIGVNRNLGFFTIGYNYMIPLLIPALIVAPLYMRGEVEFGAVTQAAMAFAQVMNAFSLIVVEFQRITSFAAVTTRLGSFWEAVGDASEAPTDGVEVVHGDGRLAYESLTLLTPRDGRLLVKDLSLDLAPGRRLLVTGAAGVGTSALLRATAGLWTRGGGRICRPPPEEVLFLPQQPYLVAGTLRDQLLYGARDEKVTDERLMEALAVVGLEGMAERVGGLDAVADWPTLLSRAEQQQLAFARVLLAGRRLVFLDQATSALEAEQARRLYKALAKTATGYVSVGSEGLAEYHDVQLELQGNGGWEVRQEAEVVGLVGPGRVVVQSA